MAARTIKYNDNVDEFNLSVFAHDVVAVAERQGKAYAKANIKHALHHPKGGPEEAAKAAAEILATPSDDTWSGRTNDIKRAYYDGMRAVAGNIIRAWVRGRDITDADINQVW